jgi:hypothetical protein
MPPSDRPVEPIEKASERLRLNQRAITVVTGTSPAVPCASPSTMWKAKSCQVARSAPTDARASVAKSAPPVTTRRTSMRSTSRPASTPPTPLAMKKVAVALLASATGKPRSATNAASRIDRL